MVARNEGRGLFPTTIDLIEDQRQGGRVYSRGAMQIPRRDKLVDIVEVVPIDPEVTGGSRGFFFMVEDNRHVPVDLNVIL